MIGRVLKHPASTIATVRPAWRRQAGTAWYAVVTTVLAAVAGLFGSVYAVEIGASFPLAVGPYIAFSYKALAFWVTLLLFALLFFERQRYEDNARRSLEESSRRVEQLVETLPPKSFRGRLERSIRAVETGSATVFPRGMPVGSTRSDIALFVRSVLNVICHLALEYDGVPLVDGAAALYSANVMLFVPTSSTRGAVAIRFLSDDFDRSKLRGVLLLQHELSSTTLSEEPAPDGALPTIALPVPIDTKRGQRWTLLPGAPNAFAGEHEVDGYSDSSTLASWCEEKGDFAPSVVEQVRQYFSSGDGREIRSFVSRRLTWEGESFGVLNLHANRTDILGPALERREIFQAMVTPLLLELARAVRAFTESDA